MKGLSVCSMNIRLSAVLARTLLLMFIPSVIKHISTNDQNKCNTQKTPHELVTDPDNSQDASRSNSV